MLDQDEAEEEETDKESAHPAEEIQDGKSVWLNAVFGGWCFSIFNYLIIKD